MRTLPFQAQSLSQVLDFEEYTILPKAISKIHSGPVTALHVLPEFLVTASKDRDVKLWERPSMQLVSVYVCVCVCVRRTKGMSESKLGVRKDRRSKLFSSLLLAIMCN